MINLENTYSELPTIFYEKVKPSAAISPSLIKFNKELASDLGINLDEYSSEELANYFSGKSIFENSTPIAMAYAGHQFGHFVPLLGDGRACLIGEVVDKNNVRFDLHLKGSGRTPYSRRGDGVSSLGPVIREYILSEAMYSLKIPTSRALAAVLSGDQVAREELLPGGIFTRVSKSHIRVGTFELFASRGDLTNLKVLADYCIDRLYPEVKDKQNPYLEFFKSASKSKLDLVAKWMGLGFIHGVMNTDNTSISGETIDFGPCAFMDTFLHNKVFSSIDQMGRYAYNNQGNIAIWNLSSLANCIAPLVSDNQETAADLLQGELQSLQEYFKNSWIKVMGSKLGIFKPIEEDLELINLSLKYLEENKLDFTNTFRNLPSLIKIDNPFTSKLRGRLNKQEETLEEAIELMNKSNPYIIPRNHQVEKAINLAIDEDYSHFERLIEAYKNPFEVTEINKDLTHPPRPEEIVHQTFCGT